VEEGSDAAADQSMARLVEDLDGASLFSWQPENAETGKKIGDI